MRRPLVWLGIGVTGVFLYLAVRGAHFSVVWEALGSIAYWWLVPALATLALGIFVRALRWRYLFLPAARPSVGAVTGALLIGYFFNNVLPARAGEAARVIALHRRTGCSRPQAAGTVAVERAYDVLALLVLLFVAVPWLPPLGWLPAAAALAAALAVGLAGAIAFLALFGDRPLRFALRPLARLRFLTVERTERAAASLALGLAGIRSPRLALAAFLWTTSSWLVLGVSFWFVTLAFGLELPLLAGLLVVIATGLAMILPSSPGAVGVFEAATIVALGAYGVSASVALSYALVLHAVNLVPFWIAGALVLRLYGSGLRRPAGDPSDAVTGAAV